MLIFNVLKPKKTITGGDLLHNLNIPKYQLEQSKKITITANAGLFLLGEYLRKQHIARRLNSLNIFERIKIPEADHLLALVLNLFTGGEAIRDTEYLKKDEGLLRLFNNIRIPAPHTSGDFLERFTESYIEELRKILHEMQKPQLKKLSKKLKKKIVISQDSSVYEVYGNTKEGSAMSYKGIFGFHPLFLHINDTGELLDIYFREGNAFTSEKALEMLESNITRLALYFEKITLLLDSGFFDQKIVKGIKRLENKLRRNYKNLRLFFIITSKTNNPIREKLKSEERKWEELTKENNETEEKKKRNSHTINYRLENLKKNLKKKNRVLKIRGKHEITEFFHTILSWEEECRFVYKRQKIIIDDLNKGLKLFKDEEEYFYHGYLTNIEELEKKEVVKLIDGRGNQEKFIEDFKNGLGTVHIPTKHFYGNYAYFLISMLSWNLKFWIMYIVHPDKLIHWKRFRYLYIKIGAQIILRGKYVIIRFGKGFKRFKEFREIYNRLALA